MYAYFMKHGEKTNLHINYLLPDIFYCYLYMSFVFVCSE